MLYTSTRDNQTQMSVDTMLWRSTCKIGDWMTGC